MNEPSSLRSGERVGQDGTSVRWNHCRGKLGRRQGGRKTYLGEATGSRDSGIYSARALRGEGGLIVDQWRKNLDLLCSQEKVVCSGFRTSCRGYITIAGFLARRLASESALYASFAPAFTSSSS